MSGFNLLCGSCVRFNVGLAAFYDGRAEPVKFSARYLLRTDICDLAHIGAWFAKTRILLIWERNRFVTSSDKTRFLVYGIFFLAVILLAALYRPADALPRPATQSGVVLQK